MSVRCSVTTGFFVLESCPNAAAHQCPRCRRPICPAHTHYPPGGHFAGPCPECYASDVRHLGDPRNDPNWTETFRRLFYSGAAGGPAVAGATGAAASPLFWALFSARDRRNLRRARRRGQRRSGDGDAIDVDDDAGDGFDFDDFFDS